MKYTLGYYMDRDREWRYPLWMENGDCSQLIANDINDPEVKTASLAVLRFMFRRYKESFGKQVTCKIFSI